jgi:nicotinate-nucleotide--dimethylbenzimidazole phosphoribosyltransferase
MNNPIRKIDTDIFKQASERQHQLTKPLGSLGKLESLAIRIAAMQGSLSPNLDKINITIFVADHGIAEEGVSAFPQSVTMDMIRNFSAGGAAICVIAKILGARLAVLNLGTVEDVNDLPGVKNCRLGSGTANFSQMAAMTHEQLNSALLIGREVVIEAKKTGVGFFIGGEMGIANTTAATAIACAILDQNPVNLTGPGTGLNEQGIRHKVTVIEQALLRHAKQINNQSNRALEILRYFGGFEIAALCGAYIACGQAGLPVLVDGFITSVAALLVCELQPDLKDWLIFSHASAELGHQAIITAMDAEPILDLGLRLGEASGAGVAVPLLRMACELHNNMATFADADVAGKCR